MVEKIIKIMNLIIETETQEMVFKLLAKTMNLVCKSEEEMDDYFLGLMMQKNSIQKLSKSEASEFETF